MRKAPGSRRGSLSLWLRKRVVYSWLRTVPAAHNAHPTFRTNVNHCHCELSPRFPADPERWPQSKRNCPSRLAVGYCCVLPSGAPGHFVSLDPRLGPGGSAIATHTALGLRAQKRATVCQSQPLLRLSLSLPPPTQEVICAPRTIEGCTSRLGR